MTTDMETINIHDLVAASIDARGDAPAVEDGGRVSGYRALGALVDRLAAGLVAEGVEPGQRVAAAMSKSAEGIALFLAVVRIGAVYIPINPGFTPREIANVLDDAAPALVLSDLAAFQSVCAPARPLDTLASPSGQTAATAPGGARPAAMLFTSGTTGRPKGALMTHAALVNTFVEFNRIWEITASDRFLHVLPTFHAHGLMMATLCPLFAGASIVLLGKFDLDAVLRLLPSITAMMAVPTIWSRLAEDARFDREATRGLRLATSGSAPLSPQLYDRVAELTGIHLLDRYGSTEAGMVAANPVSRPRRASVGQVLRGVELRVAEADGGPVAPGAVGRVQVRGANVFAGYWNRPELDAETWTADGYFDTGDFGILDADGYLTIVGRDKDMIISGGFNVYPREIEIALEEIDGVAEAAVFGVPHPDFGEGVVAAVVPQPGATLDPDTIARDVASRLTAYKRPKAIRVVPEFPRNPMGKVLRKDLTDRFADAFKQPA